MRRQVTPFSLTTMYVRPLVRLVCLPVLLFGLSVPTTAQAQLGKLKKMGADAVKDKAKEAAGVKNPDGTPATATANGGARVDYAITEERLTGIMDYLAPLVDEAERQSAYRTSMTTYKQQMDAANDCVNKGSTTTTPDIAAATSSRAEAMMAKLSASNEKLGVANATGNHRVMLAYSDTVNVLQIQYAALMFPSLKCPAVPYKSSAILDAEAASMARQQSGQANAPSRSNAVSPSQRVGMTTGQFGRIRERMAIWLLVQSGDLPATSEQFTDEERALLTSKNDVLKRYGPLFKDGVMPWANWGDITAW